MIQQNKYINQLNDEQVIELINFYESDYKEVAYITRQDDGIHLGLILNDVEDESTHEMFFGGEDNYILTDFDVQVIDWSGSVSECRLNYRKKMLEWFGFDYSRDYLLG